MSAERSIKLGIMGRKTGDVQKVKMEDDHTKVSISKTDITDGKEIEGAKLQVLDQDGEVVESWTTGEEHLIEYIPVALIPCTKRRQLTDIL